MRRRTTALAAAIVGCQALLDVETTRDANDAGATDAALADTFPMVDGGQDSPPTADANAVPEPTAWFGFDETLSAKVPSDLVPINSPAGYVFVKSEIAGSALQGSPEFRGVDYGNVLDMASESFTLAAWVLHSAVTVEHYSPFINKGVDISTNAAFNPGYSFGLIFNNQQSWVRFSVSDGAVHHLIDVECPRIVDGNYHFLVASCDRNVVPGRCATELWIDGYREAAPTTPPVGSLSPRASSSTEISTFSIGDYAVVPAQLPYWGIVDEAMVFRGRVLTETEIRALMKSFNRAPPIPTTSRCF